MEKREKKTILYLARKRNWDFISLEGMKFLAREYQALPHVTELTQ